jgi:TatD DNase family protein
VEYIDSHAHTNFDVFDEDREEVYARATAAGLSAIIEVGVGLEGSKRALERANSTAMVHAATGLHPTDLDDFDAQWPEFEALVRGGGMVAVGECGLDYHWMKAPKDKQERAFRLQLELARDVDLPFIVHCREAEDDLIEVLESGCFANGVVHCFGGTADHARRIVDLGLHVSFCGNVTYKKNEGFREAAKVVPADRLLLETDSPFLAPGKKRGKRNEPAFVLETAAALASLRDVPLIDLVNDATTNTRRLFRL